MRKLLVRARRRPWQARRMPAVVPASTAPHCAQRLGAAQRSWGAGSTTASRAVSETLLAWGVCGFHRGYTRPTCVKRRALYFVAL